MRNDFDAAFPGKSEMFEMLKSIPSVERIMQEPELRALVENGDMAREQILKAVRDVLENARQSILDGGEPSLSLAELACTSAALAVKSAKPRLVRVINASGIILHTNLGRAPLGESALAAMRRAAGYCSLEYDLARGERGSRSACVEYLLKELTGADSALVVNNNAAAVLLALTALAKDREVVVSRGELVEIGGSFRVPEVMAQSGALLKEVGTTNKTHISDYERAIGPNTGLLLKVHASNYKIVGFTASVSLDELAALGRRCGAAVMQDLGSGCLTDLSAYGITDEPTVLDAVKSGADLVTFSGDKLLGGPQAGVIVGRAQAVSACAEHPLFRALRPDKVTLAALEAVLSEYLNSEKAFRCIPVLSMLAKSVEQLDREAKLLADEIVEGLGEAAEVSIVEGASEAGGGALPTHPLPSRIVSVRPTALSAAAIEQSLRNHEPPIIARIQRDAILLDPRTLAESDAEIIRSALAAAFSAAANSGTN